MITTDLKAKMITRRSKAYSVDAIARATAEFEQLIAEISPTNWGYALHYNGFATQGTAAQVAALVKAGA